MSNPQRYVLIEQASGRVVNICEWDGDPKKWQPGAGILALQFDDQGNIGEIFDGDVFSPAPAEPPPAKQPTEKLVDLLVQKGALTKAEANEVFADASLTAELEADVTIRSSKPLK